MAAMLMVLCLQLTAVRHEPYGGSRIYWDISSKKMLFPSGNYARIIPLQDGRLLAVAQAGGGISVSYSESKGDVWSPPELIVANASLIPNAVPDVIQLACGDIVVGFNPRPSTPHTEDRLFGIRCVRSTDNGKTWSKPIFIYDALHYNRQGCWEPAFLELPDGELQCYFANEKNFPNSNEQEISMCRSMDGGRSWGKENRICYSAGSRDGMPVPILTENGEIVVIIEDNGWPGHKGFRATTVRTSLSDNWSGWIPRNSEDRNMIFANNDDKQFISAAPYLRKLGKNETVASWQGDRGARKGLGEDFYEMSVGVGDADGRNVKAVMSPFGLSTTQHGLWNSVTALDDGTVFALSSIGDASTGNAIYSMTGYARKGFEAAFGTPDINGSSTKEKWTFKNARQIFMGGNATRNLATMDFLYDDKNLYFYARVIDRAIFKDKVDNDGVTLALDMLNCCDTYPQEGMFRMFLDVNGSVKLYTGGSNRWTEIEVPDDVKYAVNTKSTYYEMEIAIPWKALGCDAVPLDRKMRCYVDVKDRRDGDMVTETIPESALRQSWTWPEFRLLPADASGVDSVITEEAEDKDDLSVTVNNDNVSVKSSRCIVSVSLYDMSGRRIRFEQCGANECSVHTGGCRGVFIVAADYECGLRGYSKIII